MSANTQRARAVVSVSMLSAITALALVGCKPAATTKESRRTDAAGASTSSDASGKGDSGRNKRRKLRESDDDKRCLGLVGGELTDKRPEVALLLTPLEGGFSLCTGTWVSPTTMITASHCLANTESGNARYIAGAGQVFTVAQGKQAIQAGIAPRKAFIGAPEKTVDAPDTGASDLDNGAHDIAVLVFDEAIAPAYAPVLTTKLGPSQDLTMVGYGDISIDDGEASSSTADARRRIGTNRLAKLDPEFVQQFDPDFYWVSGEASSDGVHANGQATIGHGDSGGPLFAGAALAAVAVLTMKTPESIKPYVDNREGVSLYASLQSDFAQALMRKAEAGGAKITRTQAAATASVSVTDRDGGSTRNDGEGLAGDGKAGGLGSSGCGASLR